MFTLFRVYLFYVPHCFLCTLSMLTLFYVPYLCPNCFVYPFYVRQGRVQDRTVRWLQRGLNVDNLAGPGGGAPSIGHPNRERSGSVMSGSTFSGGGGSRVPVRQTLASQPSAASFVSVGAGGPSSPGNASTREEGEKTIACTVIPVIAFMYKLFL